MKLGNIFIISVGTAEKVLKVTGSGTSTLFKPWSKCSMENDEEAF